MNQPLITLGIETSCDETAVGLYHRTEGLLAHRLYSQIALHAEHGGVVPELASRDHVRKILPLIDQLLTEQAISPSDLEGIAYTRGPGLVGALMVGSTVAQALAWGWGLPTLAVHHLEGHLLAPLLEPGQSLTPPYLALLVSGGHTMLIDVAATGSYQILGQTLDDAVGEAFDKTAKLLGLGYPGGPAIAEAALEGDPEQFTFTRPMINRPGLDFSFSGLKTQVRTKLPAQLTDQNIADVASSFEHTVADTLTIKCRRAMLQTGYQTLVVAGGVSANLCLRAELQQLADQHSWQLNFPPLHLCTDNGAMIALAGSLRLAAGERSQPGPPLARWSLESLPPIPA
ncbi:MAG: tRNA (adenosine(37)-N6)-threonylcarbamoyltransferase complex transferase subunit TsaD [Immundisolibacteraceae bacterium]|nr:tRNA (adenosine(37)-N6)-threonylcarbamoyltransferase complex transferase subunit TsaD [Immundisolibacteraceae bacterium]